MRETMREIMRETRRVKMRETVPGTPGTPPGALGRVPPLPVAYPG